MRIIIFICSKNKIDQNYWQENILKIFFWYFIVVKICVDVSVIGFYLSFLIFFIAFWFTIFYQKGHVFSFIEVFSICTYLLGEHTEMSNVFSIHKANKIFESIFTKRDLIGYCYIINIYIFIEMGSLCWWVLLFFDLSITKFYKFFHFYICIQKFIYFKFIIFHLPILIYMFFTVLLFASIL